MAKINRSQFCLVCLMVIFCATWVGCSSKPEMPDVSVIEFSGKPNEPVYVSYSKLIHKEEGGSTSNSGTGNYGVKPLDANGKREIKLDGQMTGLTVAIVGFSDDPVTAKVIAKDGSTLKKVTTTGELKVATIKLGYVPEYEPDDPMYDDPEDHVYEAREYLKEKEEQEANEEKKNENNDSPEN